MRDLQGSGVSAFEVPADSLSRRSSVVEHVIGNDGVGSSILPDGTISIGTKSVFPASQGLRANAALTDAPVRRSPAAHGEVESVG